VFVCSIGSEKSCLVLGINFVPLQLLNDSRDSRLVRVCRKFKIGPNLTNRDFLAQFVLKLCACKDFVSFFFATVS